MINNFKMYIYKYRKESIIIATAFIAQAIILFFTLYFMDEGIMWLSDSVSYFEIAKNFLYHNIFAVDINWGPEAFRTPIYPLFIAIFYFIFPNILFVIIVQNILSIINIFLVYKIGKLIFNDKIAFLASLLYIFESARLVFSSQLMSETLFSFFLILFILFSLQFIIFKDRKKIYLLSGIFLGFATLTRPIVQFLPILIFVFIFLYRFFNKDKIFIIFKKSFIFLIAFIIIIVPWVIRNGINFNMWKISSIGGENLYSYAAVRYLESKEANQEKRNNIGLEMREKFLYDVGLDWEIGGKDWILLSTRLMEPKYERYLIASAINIIKKDIISYSIMHISRMPGYLIKSSASRSYSALLSRLRLSPYIFYPFLYYLGILIWSLMYFIIFISIILNFRVYYQKKWIHIFLIIIIAYFTVFSCIHTDVGRFRQPINPLIFLYFAYSLSLLYRLKYNKVKLT